MSPVMVPPPLPCAYYERNLAKVAELGNLCKAAGSMMNSARGSIYPLLQQTSHFDNDARWPQSFMTPISLVQGASAEELPDAVLGMELFYIGFQHGARGTA